MEGIEIPEEIQRIMKADEAELPTDEQKTKRKMVLKNKI
jgi:hypothetical protein